MKNPFKTEKKKYLVTQYQVIYKSGTRDNVKPAAPIEVDNIKDFRAKKKAEYDCEFVNLTYMEL